MTFDPNFMLASDFDEAKSSTLVWAQPKIDGVRAGNFTGQLTGRSKKEHGNRFTTNYFSHPAFLGLDGELAVQDERHPDLCRLTTSAINSYEGEPWLAFHVFDYVTPDTITQPYDMRYLRLHEQVSRVRSLYPEQGKHLKIVQCTPCQTLEEVLAVDARFVGEGYEGTITRRPNMPYKAGRSTAREGGLLRIKQFADDEAIVLEVIEGQSNQNEATTDARGYTERSTHQENMVPNGMVGALLCKDIKTKLMFTCAAGKLNHDERKLYFQRPSLIVGKTIKYKHFLKGRKDLPRFPTFQGFRAASDM